MTLTPSRILMAAPRTLEVRLEIANAIRKLAEQHDERRRVRGMEVTKVQCEHELVAEIVRDAWQFLREAGFNRDEPRILVGNVDSIGMADTQVRLVKASPDDAKHPGWPAGTPEGRGGKFRPKDSDGDSSAHAATLTIQPCGTAFSLCMRSTFHDNPQCWAALQSCMNTGLPTIFPGGIVGRRNR